MIEIFCSKVKSFVLFVFILIFNITTISLGVLPLTEKLQAESVLPGYLNQDEAILAFRATPLREGETPFSMQLKMEFIEKSTGHTPQAPTFLDIPIGMELTRHSIDISGWPDGEYKVIITEIRDDGFDSGNMVRGIRKQTIPEPTPPEEPIDVQGKNILFVDDWYIQQKSNLSVTVNIPEVVPLCNETVLEKHPSYNTKLRNLHFDENGNIIVELGARNLRNAEPVIYYLKSSNFIDWNIINGSNFKKESEAQLSQESKKIKPSFRYYKNTDGPVTLSEIKVRYTSYTGAMWGNINMPARCRFAVWEKSPEEHIILNGPVTKDKWLFGPDEIGDWSNSNDNFGGEILSPDGKTLRFNQTRLIPRNDPFKVNYDNVWSSRIQVTWTTTNGLDWNATYFSVPDFQDAQELQHYDLRVFSHGNDLQLGYLRMYDQVMQRLYTELLYSRDGVLWHRFPLRPIFFDNGKLGSWNFGYALIKDVAPWEKNGYIYQSVFGINTLHFMFIPANSFSAENRPFEREEMTLDWLKNVYKLGGRLFGENGIEASPIWDIYKSWDAILDATRRTRIAPGLMRIRKDGWFSLDADEASGQFVTKTLKAGKHLYINAKTEVGGFIKIEVLDSDGNKVGNYSDYNSATFNGDSVSHKVVWEKGKLNELPNKPLRFKISMHKAKLYSMSF